MALVTPVERALVDHPTENLVTFPCFFPGLMKCCVGNWTVRSSVSTLSDVSPSLGLTHFVWARWFKWTEFSFIAGWCLKASLGGTSRPWPQLSWDISDFHRALLVSAIMCGGQKTACRGYFSLVIMWVLGIELRSTGLATSALTH